MSRQLPTSGVPKLALPAQKKTRAQSGASAESSTSRQKGSFIHVIARVRPRLPFETNEKEAVEVLADGKTMLLGDGSNRKMYSLDKVFDSRSEEGHQVNVFDEFARNLVLESLKGYNVCIFAYGHTGSGKTYTMLGDGGFAPDVTGSEAGILPRFLHTVFASHDSEDKLANKPAPGWGYTCEFYEVYNEHINDLIAARATQKVDVSPRRKSVSPREGLREGLRVHVHPKHGVRIENLTCSVVASADEALGLVNFGNQMRTVAATTMNERSSRSHAIFTFRFEPLDAPQGKDADGPQCQSTITFVDLAGKEEKLASSNKAMQFREMCYINTSLFHLAHLITKLSDGTVDRGNLSDFRNSKLTLLLSHALMGNSRTALVATLAPLKCYVEDTVSTLNFAQSVKKIKTRPTVNNKTQKTVISELESEVRMLQKELNTTKTNNFDKEQELLTAQALINHYRTSWEEAVARSEVAKSHRQSVILKAHLLDPTSWNQASGRIAPFLTKLCDDPSLQGCCNFFLGNEKIIIGKDRKKCDIVLQGVGVTDEMCTIKCNDDGSVKVEICTDEDDDELVPRVLVRGIALSPRDNPEVSMQHSDCIIFGYAHAFRLVAPTQEQLNGNEAQLMSVRDLVRSTIKELDMASALEAIVDETGTEFKSIYPYIQNLSTRLPEALLQTILQSVHCMCPLIDEANLITAEVWDNENILFELKALTNIFDIEHDLPTLVVCVLKLNAAEESKPRLMKRHSFSMSLDQTVPMSPASVRKKNNRVSMDRALGLSENMRRASGCDMLTYVWPMEKFLWRLGEIRDIYQEGSQAEDNFMAVRQRLASAPNLNPWREVTSDSTKQSELERANAIETNEANETNATRPRSESRRSSRRISGTSWFASPQKLASSDSVERRSSINTVSTVDMQHVPSNLNESDSSPSRLVEQTPTFATAWSTLSSQCEETGNNEQVTAQEQSPEEQSLKRAAAWLEKARGNVGNESPRGSLYPCSELELPSAFKRKLEDTKLVDESKEGNHLQTETESLDNRANDEEDQMRHSEDSDGVDIGQWADDYDQPIRRGSVTSNESPTRKITEEFFRSSSCSGASVVDSPRVLASVNQMKFKIDSFCQELQKRDSQVAQLTEERDRTAAAFETLLQRIESTNGDSMMHSTTSSNGVEDIQSLPKESKCVDEQQLSCKKEDIQEMANLLESLRKQVDRLQISTERVTWQPPAFPVMHSPMQSTQGNLGSPRGFTWQSPGATPVGTFGARVISTVPVGVVTGQAQKSVDGSRPSSPIDTMRAISPGSPTGIRTRSHSPCQSPLLALKPATIPQVACSTPTLVPSSPTRLAGILKPHERIVSPPKIVSQAPALGSAPASPRCTVGTPGKPPGSARLSSQTLKRGSPGPSRQSGSLTLKSGAGLPNKKASTAGASTAPHPARPPPAHSELWVGESAPRPSSCASTPRGGNPVSSSHPASIAASRKRVPLLVSHANQGVSVLKPMLSVQAPFLRAGSPPHARASLAHEAKPQAASSRANLMSRRPVEEKLTMKRS